MAGAAARQIDGLRGRAAVADGRRDVAEAQSSHVPALQERAGGADVEHVDGQGGGIAGVHGQPRVTHGHVVGLQSRTCRSTKGDLV